jgi:transcriptional regulator with XRE-family HTH domain
MPDYYHFGSVQAREKTTMLEVSVNYRFGYIPGMRNNILKLRNERGLSQQKLADLVGTSGPQINRLEKGERRLSQDWMVKLAKALGVAPADLISDGKVKATPSAAKSPAVKMAVDAFAACISVANDLKAKKKIPQGKAIPLAAKALNYFADDFSAGKPPTTAAIKKYILSIAD